MRTPIGIHRRKYPTESVSYNIVADENGNIYLPVGGYNRSSSSRNAAYDWMVSIDDGTPVNYSGTGSAGGSITFGGYQVGSEHSITITPVTEAYGWALAYGWYETAGAPYLTRVNYDLSYMGYGSNATATGSYFRYSQYRGCSSLVIVPNEVLPNTVTSIDTYSFRGYQYEGCTSLVTAPDEVLPSSVTSVGGSFRARQYQNCTSLITAPDEVIPGGVTSIGSDFRREQYSGCTSLVSVPDEVMPYVAASIGNQFRYQQYYRCSSLVSAPDEVLPSGITSIGTSFRRAQYEGCSSLIVAPDETMPDTVTSIGILFRYYQYYGCASLTSAKLIANNIVNTSNKRGGQFTNAGNTTNPMTITIYGNEMEADIATNSCGLANANVSFIYVQPNLIEQYQQADIRSNIDDVKFGPIEEIIYKMNADDSGNLYVPIGGYSTIGVADVAYNWDVAVDGGNATNYSGTGSAGGSITLSGYAPGTNHTIKIIPTNAAYGWARAYGWYNTIGAPYLTEVFYDGSYVGYGDSATSTGGSFRNRQYQGCTSLVTAPGEVMLGSVTSIGGSFRNGQFMNCVSLTAAPDEVLPSGVTNIGTSFRAAQYSRCTSLVAAPNEVISSLITSIGGSFRQSQYYGCTSLTSAVSEAMPSGATGIGNNFRAYQYYQCSSLVTAPDEVLPSGVTTIGNYFRDSQYYQCTSLTSAKLIANNTVSTTKKRNNQFGYAGNTTTPMTITISGSEVELDMATNSCGLLNNRVATIYVPSALVQGYKDAAIWSNITDSKFVGY